MLSRVWSVYEQRGEERRRENRGEKWGKKWLLLCSQTVSKPTLPFLSRDEAHAGAEGRQTPKISSCFPNSSSCSFREKLFFPACVWRVWSLPLPQTLHELPLFLQRLLGVESKGEIFSDFLMKISGASLLRVVALRIFGEKFLRLVETVAAVEREHGIHQLSLSSLDFRFVASDELRRWWRWIQSSLFLNFWQAVFTQNAK